MHHLLSAPMMLDLAASDQFFDQICKMAAAEMNGFFVNREGREIPFPTNPEQAAEVGLTLTPQSRFDLEGGGGDHLDEMPFPVIDGTAYIELKGVLGKRLPWWAAYFGMTDLDVFQANLRLAEESGEVERVKCRGHTPGGSVIGIEETMIQVAGMSKETTFESDTYFASAGYFIASSFDSIVVTRSARVGSIGVIMGLYDMSGWIQGEMKVKPIVVRSGPNKAPGYLMGEKITEQQIALFKKDIDRLFKTHDAYLQEYRPQIDETMKDGRVVSGTEAYYAGLADDIVNQIENNYQPRG